LTHSRSYESNAKRPCSPRRTKGSALPRRDLFLLPLNTNFLAFAHSHLALQHGMSFALLPSTRDIADIDSLNVLSPRPAFLHSTPGIFYGSNTTRTSLNRATALNARQSVSKICLRGGCRSYSAAQCLQAHGLNLQAVAFFLPSRTLLHLLWQFDGKHGELYCTFSSLTTKLT
jgi:hypothetical protein